MQEPESTVETESIESRRSEDLGGTVTCYAIEGIDRRTSKTPERLGVIYMANHIY